MVNYAWNEKYFQSFKQDKIMKINQFFKESHYKIFFPKTKTTFKSSYVTIQGNFFMLWEQEIITLTRVTTNI